MEISLSNVTVKVGPERRLLFKIPSLDIKSGQRVLIKGASGKGKTTFLHLLAGLFTPDEGVVRVGKTELNRLNEEDRCVFRRDHVGIVFQKLNLIEHLTAVENIELSSKGKTQGADALEALKAVGLQGRENDRVAVMSLGEQQRVAIARVLAGQPKMVFADEPTSSLDEANTFSVIELLLKACENKTLIVVSHDHRIEKYFSKTHDFKDLIEK